MYVRAVSLRALYGSLVDFHQSGIVPLRSVIGLVLRAGCDPHSTHLLLVGPGPFHLTRQVFRVSGCEMESSSMVFDEFLHGPHATANNRSAASKRLRDRHAESFVPFT